MDDEGAEAYLPNLEVAVLIAVVVLDVGPGHGVVVVVDPVVVRCLRGGKEEEARRHEGAGRGH